MPSRSLQAGATSGKRDNEGIKNARGLSRAPKYGVCWNKYGERIYPRAFQLLLKNVKFTVGTNSEYAEMRQYKKYNIAINI